MNSYPTGLFLEVGDQVVLCPEIATRQDVIDRLGPITGETFTIKSKDDIFYRLSHPDIQINDRISPYHFAENTIEPAAVQALDLDEISDTDLASILAPA